MADNSLATRIQLKYDILERWLQSNLILKRGEMAIAEIPSANTLNGQTNLTNPPEHTPPVIGIKIGDGEHRFVALPWIQAIAGDVHEWAKSSTIPSATQIPGLQTFVEQHTSNIGISGVVPVEQGGTGLQTVPANNVLVGNGTSPLTTIPIGTTITDQNTNALVTSGAVQSYITLHIGNLTGAMHFIGRTITNITNNSTTKPVINGSTITDLSAGDVVIHNTAEYVWDGTQWLLLGDEGSYVLSGQIRNSDIAVNAAIDISKINGLQTLLDTLTANLNNKVDKIEGKGLSTNDYTTEEKNKLSNIESGAQINTIEHIKVNGIEQTITNKTINLTITGGQGGQTIISGDGLQYRIIQNPNNTEQYIVQYWDPTNNTWITDNNSDIIDLTSLYNYIYDANGLTLDQRIINKIINYADNLDFSDQAVENKFVTTVSETNGIIHVERDYVTIDNIQAGSQPLSVEKGGTGHTTFSAGQILIGANDGSIQTISLQNQLPGTTNDANKPVTVQAVIDYVQNKIESLPKAMQFLGLIDNDSRVYDNSPNRFIYLETNHSVSIKANDGDVVVQILKDQNGIVTGSREYVWDGTNWRLLGDESSYAIKGAIQNSDIAANANIAQSKISGLESALDNKINVDPNKNLVANNLITLLTTINENQSHWNNAIEKIYVNNVLQPINQEDKSVSLTIGSGGNGTIVGAIVPNATNNGWEAIETNNENEFKFARIAKTGNITDIIQDDNTYILFDAGTSTTVI